MPIPTVTDHKSSETKASLGEYFEKKSAKHKINYICLIKKQQKFKKKTKK